MEKYIILEQVGAGAYGYVWCISLMYLWTDLNRAVYKAKVKSTNEIVALKKMYQQNDEEGWDKMHFLILLTSSQSVLV